MRKYFVVYVLIGLLFLFLAGCSPKQNEKRTKDDRNDSKETAVETEKSIKNTIPKELENYVWVNSMGLQTDTETNAYVLGIYKEKDGDYFTCVLFKEEAHGFEVLLNCQEDLNFFELMGTSFEDNDGDQDEELSITWSDSIGYGTTIIDKVKGSYKIVYNGYNQGISWEDVNEDGLKDLMVTSTGGGYSYIMPRVEFALILKRDTFEWAVDETIAYYKKAYQDAKKAYEQKPNKKTLNAYLNRCIMSGRSWEIPSLYIGNEALIEFPYLPEDYLSNEGPLTYMENYSIDYLNTLQDFFNYNGSGDLRMFVFPQSSIAILEESDFENKTAEELVTACNELLARHGIQIEDATQQAYFESLPWYMGQTSGESLSELETTNLKLINQQLLNLEGQGVSFDTFLSNARVQDIEKDIVTSGDLNGDGIEEYLYLYKQEPNGLGMSYYLLSKQENDLYINLGQIIDPISIDHEYAEEASFQTMDNSKLRYIVIYAFHKVAGGSGYFINQYINGVVELAYSNFPQETGEGYRILKDSDEDGIQEHVSADFYKDYEQHALYSYKEFDGSEEWSQLAYANDSQAFKYPAEVTEVIQAYIEAEGLPQGYGASEMGLMVTNESVSKIDLPFVSNYENSMAFTIMKAEGKGKDSVYLVTQENPEGNIECEFKMVQEQEKWKIKAISILQ